MSSNPYETSFSSTTPEVFNDSSELYKSSALSLARWQTFFGVLGVLLSLFVVGYLLVIFLTIAVSASGNSANAIGAGIASLSVGLLLVLIYVIPTVKLWQASSAMRRAAFDARELPAAIKSQLSFWRTIGFITIIVLALYFFVILFGVGIMMTRSGF